MTDLHYRPSGAVLRNFLRSKAFVQAIRGPVGSGKSTAACIKILRNAAIQTPHPQDGIRRSRYAIIRNSYPQLKSTTMKTWLRWCPETAAKINWSAPISQHIIRPGFDMEILFLAMDLEADVAKALSLEVTAIFVNEAREIPKSIIDVLTTRTGRYPPIEEDAQGNIIFEGAVDHFLAMDTNPPDNENWWYHYAEEELDEGEEPLDDWEFFAQPGGRDEHAENLRFLKPDYYKKLAQGKSADWIKVYVDGQYGYVVEGRPVYPQYRDSVHCSDTALQPVPGIPIQMGYDFGLQPAAILGQRMPNGQLRILAEICGEDCGMFRFAEHLIEIVATEYPNYEIIVWPDPAGHAKSPINEKEAVAELKGVTPDTWKWGEVQTNDLGIRRDAVINCLNRLIEGVPGLIISRNCAILRKGFVSGYHFKVMEAAGGPRPSPLPDKNRFSNPHDALQYLCLGSGEYDKVMSKPDRKNKNQVKIAADVGYYNPEIDNVKRNTSMLQYGIRPFSNNEKPRPKIARDMDSDV